MIQALQNILEEEDGELKQFYDIEISSHTGNASSILANNSAQQGQISSLLWSKTVLHLVSIGQRNMQ